jgi:hypothetical protein
VFIELTDHLRCPEEHDEAYLVLLPSAMDGRDVRAGELGCPVCGRTWRFDDGLLDFGGAPPAEADSTALTPEAMAAFLGLGGPGGYFVLVGAPAGAWQALLEAQPAVAPVVLNPPAGTPAVYPASVVRAGRIPLKSRSMRGVVLGPGYADDPAWLAEAARVVLPGLRVVGEGPPPGHPALELLGTAGGCWVAGRSSRG